MTRTDIHRPSQIQPEDYEFVAIEVQKIEGYADVKAIIAEREMIQAHMARTGGTYSQHAHGGNCHVCGAHAVYTVLFYHALTNAYIRTGEECADKLMIGDTRMFRSRLKGLRKTLANARKLQAGKQKAQVTLADAGLDGAWELYNTDPQDSDRYEEVTIRDIVGKLVKYGSISERATSFLGSLLDRIANRDKIAAQRAAEYEAAAEVPFADDERATMRGKILTLRNDDFGHVKMLVQHADGWKLWGTLPASLDDLLLSDQLARGDEVEFTATIKRSDRDPKFGFYRRPSKARKVA